MEVRSPFTPSQSSDHRKQPSDSGFLEEFPSISERNMAFKVSSAEMISFYAIDRELYTRLVTVSRLRPIEANRIMAFWLWLEKMGLPSMIMMLRTAPDIIVSVAAGEALVCLACLESENQPEQGTSNPIPISSHILGGFVSLRFLHQNRRFALDSIMKTLAEVCARALAGILRGVASQRLVSSAEGNRPSGSNHMNLQVSRGRPVLALPQIPYMNLSLHPRFQSLLHFRGSTPVQTGVRPLLPTPPFPRPGLQRTADRLNFETGESSSRPSSTRLTSTNDPPAERSMFMTFSRGYAVSEDELRGYISTTYGDVLEEVRMASVPPGVQPLYAVVIFRTAQTVDAILNGRDHRKFVIDGKHVICRRWKLRI